MIARELQPPVLAEKLDLSEVSQDTNTGSTQGNRSVSRHHASTQTPQHCSCRHHLRYSDQLSCAPCLAVP
jgi:hypothetical protein